jgi:UDP-N-acetylmuramoyl-tripeptide--D-alanyl-D-alanine ligase
MTIKALYTVFKKHPVVCTDTRTVSSGSIFFALKGASFNGNTFAHEALSKGVAYAVVDEKEFAKDDRFILVADVLQTLQGLANYHRRQLSCPVLAITGSNGKTTTKELITKILSKKFNTQATKGNLNNHIGVPLTILSASPQTEFLIVEMGANHLNEIASLCAIAEPDYGIITNVGKAHLEGFGGFEGVMKGKGELYDFLAKHNGLAFVNSYNSLLAAMVAKAQVKRIVKYGTKAAECIGALVERFPFLKIEWGTPNSKLQTPNSKLRISTHLIGDYNFENILAAICIGIYFGVSAADINAAVGEYIPDNNRSQILQKGSNTIILDAYNANPTSVAAALKNFAAMKTDGKEKIVMLGEMAELGAESGEEHRRIVQLIEELSFKKVFLIGKQFNQPTMNGRFPAFNNVEDAAKHVGVPALKNSFILIKGSRSAQMEKILESV